MLQTLKGLLESKPFVASVLTAIAAAAAVFGYHVDVTTVLIVITPIEVAIGATGWGENAMRHQVEAQVRMHMMTLEHARASTAVGDAKNAQSGFTVPQMMIAVVVCGGLLMAALSASVTITGCKTTPPIVTDTIDCVKAEAAVVTSGYDIVQLVNEVYADIKSEGFLGAVLKLAELYGLDVVACIIDSYPAAEPSGSGSGTSLALDYQKKQGALQKLAPGKKFNHGPAKQ